MPINLRDIRDAVIEYVDTKVTLTVNPAEPTKGTEIDPKEDFTFRLIARNADAASGGVKLTDVIWHVWVEDPTIGKLYVPANHVRSGLSADLPLLSENTLVNEMYIFPPYDRKHLGVGEVEKWDLTGKAGTKPGGGLTNIRFKVYADVDRDYLFPPQQASTVAAGSLKVKG